jgi:streptogramin lyase
MRRRGLVGAAGMLVLMQATACGGTTPSSEPTSAAGTTENLDELPVIATLPLPGEPMLMSVAGGKLWISFVDDGSIAAVDPNTTRLGSRTRLGNGAGSPFDNPLAGAEDQLWAADNANERVHRVDPKSGTIGEAVEANAIELTLAFGSVWIAQFESYTVVRVDPATGRITAQLSASGPTDVDAGAGSMWVLAHRSDEVLRIDPATNRVSATIQLKTAASTPERMAFGEDALWVTDPPGNSVTRVDTAANRAIAEVKMPVRSWPFQVATGGGFVWVMGEQHVFRLDPDTNTVTGAALLHEEAIDPRFGALTDVEYAFGSVWAIDRAGHTLFRLQPTT